MPVDLTVELLRRRLDGQVVPWLLTDDGEQPSKDLTVAARIDAVLARLGATLLTARASTPEVRDRPFGAAGDVVLLDLRGHRDLSSFAFEVFTTDGVAPASGVFVIERTMAADPTAAPAHRWHRVGAFRWGTRAAMAAWTNTFGSFHGNTSSATGMRVRVLTPFDKATLVDFMAQPGTGTITVGAIASNEGNIIGTVADLEQHYASAEGGYLLFNATTGPLTLPSGAAGATVALFENPASSGRDLRVYRITTASARQAVVWERFRNAVVATRGTARDNVNRGGGTPTSVARLYTASQFTVSGNGSSAESHATASGGTDRDLIRGGIRLTPGQSVLFRGTNIGSGLGGDATVAAHLVWADLPAVA